MFSIESYLAGIRRAHEEGLITYADHYVPDPGGMKYSNHISWEINGVFYEGGLSFTNTRPLFDGIRLALDYFKDGPVKFLELGPGAGNACYELDCLAKTIGADVTIHTVSYTPINPYMPLLRSGDQLLRLLASNPDLKLMKQESHGCSWYILDKDLFRLPDEDLAFLYGKLEVPYIHLQNIGYFPRKLDLPSEGFDIIYDMFGPLHREDVGAVVDAYSRLSEKGMLFFVFHARYEPGQIMLDGAKRRLTPIFNKSDTVVVDTRNHFAIVAREKNALAAHFRKKFKSTYQTVPANDMIGFIKWLKSDP
jgi:hypothetical protein